MKYYAIIVAGGSGSRMQADIPKQFLLLNGKPILMHTLEAFYNSTFKPELILVLNVDFHSYWEQLCREHQFIIPHILVKAGNQRFYSVKNGLKKVSGTALVAIHDAVRPLVSEDLITRSYQEAERYGNAIAAVKSKDSIRQINASGSVPLNREGIFLVQTPQVFQSALLKKAYQQPYRIEFTDDATVVEKTGTIIRIITGDNRNIKITYPEDILLAQFYLTASRNNSMPAKTANID
ncbi:MAG TPA: 2-C-methyl-D-erythritol 4-phosphate cytidylyltransferase [Daejeonella sp.]|nr:2-C-methyl-D-erythritol 4-phosphate cytidylyltransferase [Daejeonella sp.]